MNRPGTPDFLKFNWERHTPQVNLTQAEVAAAVSAFTTQAIESYALLSSGCANSNYKISLANGEVVILRVYTRDPRAIKREARIHQLVQDTLPVPRFLSTFDECKILPLPFAFIEYVDGILFRDLILQNDLEAIKTCAYQAGQFLQHMAAIQFDTAGFFNDDLSIRPFAKDQNFISLINSQLANPEVIGLLGKELVTQLHTITQQYHAIIAELSNHKNLTHADYDPTNMLVVKDKLGWRISGILDWEFALSSTYYIDIGLMLRYAHKLPECFQASFIQGIQEDNSQLLSHDWEKRAKLADIVSLLSFFESNPIHKRPVMYQDIKDLLRTTCEFMI